MLTVPTPDVLLQGIISGLLMGCIYALIAAGLSLIFGLMEIVNFAHGEFLMLAMYTTFFIFKFLGVDPYLSVFITVPLFFVLGVALHKGVIKHILHAPEEAQVIATLKRKTGAR